MLYKQWIKPWINLHTKHGRLFSHGDVDSAVHQRRNCIMFTRHHRNCAKQFKQKSITVTGRPGCKPAPFAPQASSSSTQRIDHRFVCPTEKWTKGGWFQKCSQWEPFHSDLKSKDPDGGFKHFGMKWVTGTFQWGTHPGTMITVFTGRGHWWNWSDVNWLRLPHGNLSVALLKREWPRLKLFVCYPSGVS